MATLSPERLSEVAAAWRSGVDVDDLQSPAGPLFDNGEYAIYDITMTGPWPLPETYNTVVTGAFEPGPELCMCCGF